jgi:hypothetical protein
MTRCRLLLTSALVAALASTARPSTAETFHESGLTCRRSTSSAAGQSDISWLNFGVSNGNSSSTAKLVCPLPWTGDDDAIADDTVVHYMDSNNDNAAAATVSCNTMGVEYDGDTWVGSTAYSCAFAGGCSSNIAPTYTNVGSEAWLQVEGLHLDQDAAAYVLYCSLPDVDGLLPSVLLTYSTDID